MTSDKPAYAQIPMSAVKDDRLTLLDLRVLGMLSYYHRGNELGCLRSQEQISDDLKVKRESVNRSEKRLREYGYITRKRTGRSIYKRFVLPFPLYAAVPLRALRDKRMTKNAFRLLCAISHKDRAGVNGRHCFANSAALRRDSGIKGGIYRQVRKLAELGYIESVDDEIAIVFEKEVADRSHGVAERSHKVADKSHIREPLRKPLKKFHIKWVQAPDGALHPHGDQVDFPQQWDTEDKRLDDPLGFLAHTCSRLYRKGQSRWLNLPANYLVAMRELYDIDGSLESPLDNQVAAIYAEIVERMDDAEFNYIIGKTDGRLTFAADRQEEKTWKI